MSAARASWVVMAMLLLSAVGAPSALGENRLAHYGTWEVFTRQQGLPDDRVTCVCIARDAVWVGTAAGAAWHTKGTWKTLSTVDGLGDPMVTSIAWHEPTGEVWIGTLGGLTRYSAGRLVHYDQFNSGLVNDVVYGVAAGPSDVWVATSVGCGRYDLLGDEWAVFDRANSPMPEAQCNDVSVADGRVVVAVFGGGVLEYDVARERWRSFVDPDEDRVTDLLRDDGLIHDVVTSAVYDETGRLWAGTRFGLSCFDGRRWQSFRAMDSPLASDRVSCLTSRGRSVWVGTDRGFCMTDGDEWVVYERHSAGLGAAAAARGANVRYVHLPDDFPDEMINDIAFDGDDIWVATEAGLARGTLGAAVVTDVPPADETPSLAAKDRLTPLEAVPLRRYSDPYSLFYQSVVPFVGRPASVSGAAASGTVKLGFIGPLERARDTDIGREMLDGIRLALEEANGAGGCGGRPFELAVRNDRGLWGSAANEVVSLVRHDGVVALFGSVNPTSALAAAQVAERLRLPMVITAATDPALTEAGNPWLIRLMPDDRQQAYALAYHIYSECGLRFVAGMRSDDRFGYRGLAEFREASDRLGHPLKSALRWAAGQRRFDTAVTRLATTGVEAVVLWGPADDAARIVEEIRASGLQIGVFGCDRLTSETFLESAGGAASGVTAVATWDPGPDDSASSSFVAAFSERFGHRPGAFAAHAYDGARMLVDCIRRVGPDPAAIGAELARTARYSGVTGAARFDTTANVVRPMYVARIADGRTTYRPIDLAAMPANTAVAVFERALAWYESRLPPSGEPPRRRTGVRVGCLLPLDEWGNRVLRGMKLAVIEDEAAHRDAPPVLLHVHDARGDWGAQCAALVDLIREAGVLTLIGSTEPGGDNLLNAVAEREQLPVIVLHRAKAEAGGRPQEEWMVSVGPLGSPDDAFRARYERAFDDPADAPAWLGYVVAEDVIRAIREGAVTRPALRAALAERLSRRVQGQPGGTGSSSTEPPDGAPRKQR